jgi:FkbM family methyltransferase
MKSNIQTTKNLVNDAPPVVVSYAQNREDIIMDGFFDGKQSGVYVDVGANHPVADSVTKFFYLKGWTGVHIEPNPKLARLIRIDRPKDHVIEKGIALKTEERTFRIYDNTGLSTFSNEIMAESGNVYDSFKDHYQDVVTNVDTLKNVLDSIPNLSPIDFMKIDVEGLELEVIKSNDWKVYHPELICIEANHAKESWHDLLENLGYKRFFNDGLNDYYADKKSERLKKFAFPESILMRYPKIMPFIPHKDVMQVNETTFDITTDSSERTTLEKDLKGALAVLNSAFSGILIRRMIRLKRQKLTAKIQKSMAEGGTGHVEGVNFITPKIVMTRFMLVGFSLVMRVGYKLKSKMRGSSI